MRFLAALIVFLLLVAGSQQGYSQAIVLPCVPSGNSCIPVSATNPLPTIGQVATTLESQGVSTTATAAANTTAIQNALTNIGGRLTLMTCGTYQISTELQIGDNTTLELAPCVTMQRAAANMNMISTTAYHASTTSVTLSAVNTSTVTFSGSPSTAVVTWSGNPMANGQAVTFSNSGGALPTGISAGTAYYVTNSSGNTFNLLTYPEQGTLITISSNGTGTQTATQAGTLIKVTWTAHGKVVGDPISLEGADQSYYNGIFLVDTVIDANTLLVRVIRTPLAAPTGTTVARGANRRIKLLGGTWDFNYPSFAKSPLLDAVGLFGYVYDLEIGNIRGKNGGTYILDTGAQRQTWIHDIVVDSTQDIVKAYGPSFDVTVERVDGRSTDDGVSFQTQENPASFPQYIWTKGDLINCTAKRLGGNDGIYTGNVVALYIGGAGYADQIHFEDISGNQSGAPSNVANASSSLILVQGYNAADPVGTLTIKKVRGWSLHLPIRFLLGTLQHVRIEDVVYGGQLTPFLYPTNNSYVYVTSSATIYDLMVDGWSLPTGLTGIPGSSIEYDVVQIDGGAVANVTLKNISIYQAGSNIAALRISQSSSVGAVNLYDCSIVGGIEMVQVRNSLSNALGLGNPVINIHGGFVNSTGVIYTGSAITVNMTGVNIVAASIGIVTSDQNVTIDIYQRGNQNASGAAWTHVYGNTPVFNFRELNILTLSADQTGTNGTGAQTWFPGGGATSFYAPASSTYLFEGQLVITRSGGAGAAHTMALLFALGGSLTSIEYNAIILDTTSSSTFALAAPNMLLINVATATTVTASSSGAAEATSVYVRGIVRTNAAGTIAPQFQYQTNAPTGTVTVNKNTFFTMTPVTGSDTLLSFPPPPSSGTGGPWQ